MAFETLFEKYDRLVLFDTETTGLFFSRDEIIEFAAVVVEQRNGEAAVVQEYDELISLSPGNTVPPKIEQLTGISTMDILERGGLAKVGAEGEMFDPNFHEAVMQEPADGVESGTILQVFQPGYKYQDKLLRAAMVKVAQ